MKYCKMLVSRIHSLLAPGISKRVNVFICLILLSSSLAAQEPTSKPVGSAMSDPFVITMIIVMVILLLFIGLLANVVTGSAALYRQRQLQAVSASPDMMNEAPASATGDSDGEALNETGHPRNSP